MKKIMIIGFVVFLLLIPMFMAAETTEACNKGEKKMTDLYERYCPPKTNINYVISNSPAPNVPVSWGQIFTVGATGLNREHRLYAIELKAWRTGVSPGWIDVYICEISGFNPGATLSSGSFNGDILTDSSPGENIVIAMTPYPLLSASGQYCFIVKKRTNTNTDTVSLVGDEVGWPGPSRYPGGRVIQATPGWEYSEIGMAIYFKEWGYGTKLWFSAPAILNLRAKAKP